MENQSGQLKPPSDQFPVFAPDVTMSGIAVTGRGKISTTTTDPAVTLLSDYPHRPPAIFVTITDTGDTSFIADPVFPAQQHVFYRTKASPILPNSSAIGHIFYDTLGRRLFADDWTGLANAAAAAGDPATFALGYQQHVFYRDVPGNIQHIFYDAISQLLVTDNWRQLSGAPFAAGDAATMTTPGQQHVFYRGKGGHVQHILYDAGSAKLANDDWSQKANLVAQSVLAAGDPATMTTPGQQHVFYRDKRGHVQHMLSDGSPNVFSDDWSQKANLVNQSVLAAGDPATMTTPEQQHVFYRDKRGHVQHMLSDGSPSVFSDDWSQKANLVNQPVLAAGEPATMVTPNQQHVFYGGADMHIHHILFDMGAGFASDDWTARGTTPGPVATNPAPATGNPATMTTPGQQHVFYRGVGGSIEHLFYDGATPTVIHYDSWTRMAPRAAAAANDPAISTMTTGQ